MARKYKLDELLGAKAENKIFDALYYNLNHWPRLAADDVPYADSDGYEMRTVKSYEGQLPFVKHFYEDCLPNRLLETIRKETGDSIALWSPERDATGFTNGYYKGFTLKPGLRWADNRDDWLFSRGARGEDLDRKIFAPQIVCIMEPHDVYCELREEVKRKWKDGTRTIRQFKKNKYETAQWWEKMANREKSNLRIVPIEIIIRSTITNFEVGESNLELRSKSRWHDAYFGKEQGLLDEKIETTDKLCQQLRTAARELNLM